MQPRRIWWARPRKLCAMERPGGGGRSHRPGRREGELAWLRAHGVRLVVSTMPTRHNLSEYERVGLAWHHLPLVGARRRRRGCWRRRWRCCGASYGGAGRWRCTAIVTPTSWRRSARRTCTRPAAANPTEGLAAAADAGLMITPWSAALLGVDYEAVQPRSRMAASTGVGPVGDHVGVHDRALGVDRDGQAGVGSPDLGDRSHGAARAHSRLHAAGGHPMDAFELCQAVQQPAVALLRGVLVVGLARHVTPR